MRHRVCGRKFGRRSGARSALLWGLARQVVHNEYVKTTLERAKEVRPLIDRLVTLGKRGGLARRRQIISLFPKDDTLHQKIMTTLKSRYATRPGGYTRITKAGYRHGDSAACAIIELVDREQPLNLDASTSTPTPTPTQSGSSSDSNVPRLEG
jgi:large subunit ribosomal protein L17